MASSITIASPHPPHRPLWVDDRALAREAGGYGGRSPPTTGLENHPRVGGRSPPYNAVSTPTKRR